MVEVRRDADRYEVNVTDTCRAPASAVYDLLADLPSHLEWGGRRVPEGAQRLLSLNAPDGPATLGVEFESVGSTATGEWRDHSRVTEATRPNAFEFVTEGSLEYRAGAEPVQATWVHRYEIVSQDEGCKVLYRLRLSIFDGIGRSPDFPHPAVFFNVVIPSYLERGLRNLVTLAEEQFAAEGA
jgi:hypothetical protein